MNRHERRAAAADSTKAAERAAILRTAIAVLAGSADTATGATILHPDGTVTYIPRETADAMAGTAPARGRA